MRVKVINGTPQHGVTLCDSCTNSKRRRGVRLGDVWYRCEEFAGPIHQPVVECNQYHDDKQHLPAEMMRQAFRWVPSLKCFLAPVEWEQRRMTNKLPTDGY